MALRTLVLLAITALSASCSAARLPPPETAGGNLAQVEVLDRTNGTTLPVYWHRGERWIAGAPGHRYAITVRNRSNGRLLMVVAVDGVNAVSGETASWNQTGYVLDPGRGFDIRGWRKSQERVAAFEFTALDNSYAARTGRPDNVGVIGVAVFNERPRAVPYGILKDRERAESVERAENADRAAAAPMPAAPPAQDAQAKSQLGTGHGRSESSYAQYTSFQRASDRPSETIAIYYDSYENLLAQGVPVRTPPIARYRPDPFPDRGRFVPDPR